MADFEVKFSGGDDFKAEMGKVQVLRVGADPYEGEYIVTPKIDPQILETKDRIMADDVQIKAIPVFRVSNTSGGTTVYIANEV